MHVIDGPVRIVCVGGCYLTGTRGHGRNFDSPRCLFLSERNRRKKNAAVAGMDWSQVKEGKGAPPPLSLMNSSREPPAATAGQTACRRRPRPAALPCPPRRPSLLEPPPPPVCRRPGHPSKPRRSSSSPTPTTSPTPIPKFSPHLRRGRRLCVVRRLHVVRRLRLDPSSQSPFLPRPAPAWWKVAGFCFQAPASGFSRRSREQDLYVARERIRHVREISGEPF
jgi:hypothetical protein